MYSVCIVLYWCIIWAFRHLSRCCHIAFEHKGKSMCPATFRCERLLHKYFHDNHCSIEMLLWKLFASQQLPWWIITTTLHFYDKVLIECFCAREFPLFVQLSHCLFYILLPTLPNLLSGYDVISIHAIAVRGHL